MLRLQIAAFDQVEAYLMIERNLLLKFVEILKEKFEGLKVSSKLMKGRKENCEK